MENQEKIGVLSDEMLESLKNIIVVEEGTTEITDLSEISYINVLNTDTDEYVQYSNYSKKGVYNDT